MAAILAQTPTLDSTKTTVQKKTKVSDSEYRAIFIVAGITSFLLLVTFIVSCIYICYRYKWKCKKRGRDGYHIISSKTPDITIQPYEFVLPPSRDSRRFSSLDFTEDHVFEPRSNSPPQSPVWSSAGCLLSTTSLGSNNRSLGDLTIDIPETTPSNGQRSSALRKFSEPSHLSPTGINTSLGLLRPELYYTLPEESENTEYPPGHIGRLWFRLEYNTDSEQLIVTLHSVKNLPARQQRGSISISGTSTCDPFVRIYLLPDEKRYLQSSMKRKTTSPTFGENFIFVMSYGILSHRVLRFSVFDVDRFMRQSVIGHVLYPLERMDITTYVEQWGDLVKSSKVHSHTIGEILIATTYFPQQSRIGITVIEAKNLKHNDYPLLDPYTKVSYSVLTKVMKTKRTNVQQATNNPSFNSSFEFKVNIDQLNMGCITVEVMHSVAAALKNDKHVGKIAIGGVMCSKGRELDHWNEMIQNPRISVKNWFCLHNQ